MYTFLLYFDLLSSKCTSEAINNKLSLFTESYIQATDNIWLFKWKKKMLDLPYSCEETFFYKYFEKLIGKNGTFFIIRLEDNYYCQLPDFATAFLSED